MSIHEHPWVRISKISMDPSLIKVFPGHAAPDDGGCNAIRAASSLLLQRATWQSMAEEKVVRVLLPCVPKKVYSFLNKASWLFKALSDQS